MLVSKCNREWKVVVKFASFSCFVGALVVKLGSFCIFSSFVARWLELVLFCIFSMLDR